MRSPKQLVAISTFALMSLGCSNSGEQAVEQSHRESGSAELTTTGLKTLTEQLYLPVGNLNCPLGGLKIVSGEDRDRSGNLQPEEITSVRYQCTPSVPLGAERNSSTPDGQTSAVNE